MLMSVKAGLLADISADVQQSEAEAESTSWAGLLESESTSGSQLQLSISSAAAADQTKKPGFHIVSVEAEMLMSLKAGLLAPPACSEATDPDHPSESCSKCMDYADALRVAAETLEEMPVYTCYVEGVGQCLTLLSSADVEEIGLLPTAGIIGVLNSHSEHEKSWGEIGGSGTNPSFTELMHQAIAAHGPPKKGFKEGWVYMIDRRTPTPEGSVPPSDIYGSFKVDRKTKKKSPKKSTIPTSPLIEKISTSLAASAIKKGVVEAFVKAASVIQQSFRRYSEIKRQKADQTVVKDSYRPNENYQLLSDQGHGLCQLPGMYYAAIVQAIKTRTVGFALADGTIVN
jgi:hypothetical protein